MTAKPKGLLRVHLISGASGEQQTLISYWKSRDHYELYGAGLLRSLAAAVIRQGPFAPVTEPKTPWIKKVDFGKVVPWVLTVVTTALALRAHYFLLLGVPHVTFDPPAGVENHLESEPFKIECKIKNVGHCNAKLYAVTTTTTPVSGIAFVSGLSQPGEIPPNDALTLQAVFKGDIPGDYTVKFSGGLSNGMFINRSWSGLSLNVHVWPVCRAFITGDPRCPADKHICVLAGTIEIGRSADNGVEVAAILSKHPDIDFDELNLEGQSQPVHQLRSAHSANPSKTVTKIGWTVERAKAFTNVPFSIVLKSSRPMPPPEWADVAHAIRLDASLK
jgi:hypothetical protein